MNTFPNATDLALFSWPELQPKAPRKEKLRKTWYRITESQGHLLLQDSGPEWCGWFGYRTFNTQPGLDVWVREANLPKSLKDLQEAHYHHVAVKDEWLAFSTSLSSGTFGMRCWPKRSIESEVCDEVEMERAVFIGRINSKIATDQLNWAMGLLPQAEPKLLIIDNEAATVPVLRFQRSSQQMIGWPSCALRWEHACQVQRLVKDAPGDLMIFRLPEDGGATRLLFRIQHTPSACVVRTVVPPTPDEEAAVSEQTMRLELALIQLLAFNEFARLAGAGDHVLQVYRKEERVKLRVSAGGAAGETEDVFDVTKISGQAGLPLSIRWNACHCRSALRSLGKTSGTVELTIDIENSVATFSAAARHNIEREGVLAISRMDYVADRA